MSRKRILSGTGALMADKIVITVIQLALVPVLANVWGLELYGIWAMMITIPVFLAMGDFGIVAAAWARMTAFLARDEWDEARTALHTAWLAAGSSACILAALAAIVLFALPSGVLPASGAFDDSASRQTALVLVLYGLGMIIFRLNTAIFRAGGRFPLAIWCNTISYTLENAALVAAVVLGAPPLDAAITLLAMRVLALAIVFAFSFRLFPRLSPGFAWARMHEWRQLWRPALSATSFAFATAIFLQGSVVALGSAAGAVVVPAFVAVRTLSRLGIQVVALVGGPLAQEFGHVAARGDWFSAGRYFAIVSGAALFLGTGMAVGLLALGPWAIDLWTVGAIDPAYSLIAAMALSSLLGILWNPLSNLILAVNRQSAIALPSVFRTFGGIAIIVVTADRLGATAAGIAFAGADLVMLAFVGAFVARNWLSLPEFRRGMASPVFDLRSALALIFNRREKGSS